MTEKYEAEQQAFVRNLLSHFYRTYKHSFIKTHLI